MFAHFLFFEKSSQKHHDYKINQSNFRYKNITLNNVAFIRLLRKITFNTVVEVLVQQHFAELGLISHTA